MLDFGCATRHLIKQQRVARIDIVATAEEC
jgi:hypothetical protein